MFQIIFYIVYYLLSAVSLAFLIRMLLSFLAPESDNFFTRTVVFLTELFAVPIRMLFEKKNWFSDTPLDMAFLFAYIMVSLLKIILVAFV